MQCHTCRRGYTKAVKLPLEPSSSVEDIIGQALGYIELEVRTYMSRDTFVCPCVRMCVHRYVHPYVRMQMMRLFWFCDVCAYVCTYLHTYVCNQIIVCEFMFLKFNNLACVCCTGVQHCSRYWFSVISLSLFVTQSIAFSLSSRHSLSHRTNSLATLFL